MTQLIRNTLVAALVVLTPAFALARQQPNQADEPPTVSATGEGMVQAAPDRAWVTITAESRAGNPRAAQERNAEAMTPVLARLKAAGIAEDAIETVAYDLQQEWDYVEGRRISRGYVARNSIEVRIDDIDRVGELLELAVGSGATSVGGVRFGLKDRDKLEREALRLAVRDARARAEAVADAAGLSIARVHHIEVQPTAAPPIPYPHVAMLREQASDAAAPPISAGQMEIRAHVTLTAVLK